MIVARSYWEDYCIGETDLLLFDKKTMKFKEYICTGMSPGNYSRFGNVLYHQGWIYMYTEDDRGDAQNHSYMTHARLEFDP